MTGGSLYCSIWLPQLPMAMQFFECEYEWEEYPGMTHGGSLFLTDVTWLTQERPCKYGINVPFQALEWQPIPGGFTLHELLCNEIHENALENFIDDCMHGGFDD